MNAKSSTKALLFRVAAVFMIAMMLFAVVPAIPTYASSVTYNFQPDSGTTVATGVVTNDTVCATNSTVSTITLMNTAALSCPLHIIRPPTSGAQNILDVWFDTAYVLDTTVTGTSLKIRLRELSGIGGDTAWTAGI